LSEIFELLDNDELPVDRYDEPLVRRLIESVKVLSADRLQITFKFGTEMEQPM
jgi:hypothetical protein